ncbi:MAG: dTMP kinase [Candidatus Yanofskybacteria bacterium]|nr:dTMP kinase [Candidatus Yanofskybacteria bacterium]
MFILLEGPEGSGKSTAARQFAECLSREFDPDVSVVSLREPGSGSLGQPLRDILLNTKEPLCSEAELFLFLASRAQVMRECVVPALNAGKIVVLDRSTLSTLAYQIAGRGLPMHLAMPAIELATCGLVPDLTFLLTVSPWVAKARMRQKSPDRIEAAGDEFHHRVSRGYDMFAELLAHRAERPWKVCVIDTDDLTREQVVERMWRRPELDGPLEAVRTRIRAEHGVIE